MRKYIALSGNPNVGKSTIFNALTGMKQHTGNWPGKTIMKATGSYFYDGDEYVLVDLPGTYSLLGGCAEEEIAREYICSKEPDLILIICDATCLERNLNLVLQTLSITKKVIVCVNLLDEADKKGIEINLPLLSKLLKVPVIGTSAVGHNRKRYLNELKEMIHSTSINHLSAFHVDSFIEYGNALSKSHLCEKDSTEMASTVLQNTVEENTIMQNTIDQTTMKLSAYLASETIRYKKENYDRADRKLDQILTNPRTGIPIMLVLLGIIFWITLVGANYPSSLLSNFFLFVENKFWHLLEMTILPFWLRDLLVHGIYRVLTWVVAVMLPPMAIFFPLFTILEDFGYLPRIAFNMDHCFKKCCSCGKQALTMCMGFGCNASGVIGCRIIDSPRERLIAILTNNFVPCNGRLPTIIVLISLFYVGSSHGILAVFFLLIFIILSVLLTLLISKILSRTLLKGLPSTFTLELPPYRTPQVGKIIVSSLLNRTLFVLGRAVIIAIPAGLLIWIFANITIYEQNILLYCSNFLDPFARLIGLDGIILMAFILGFPANEIVIPIILMAYMSTGHLIDLGDAANLHQLLLSHGWTSTTALCTILFSLFHWPCSTTCLTIRKETQSTKWMLISIFIPTMTGILLCFLVASISRLFILLF